MPVGKAAGFDFDADSGRLAALRVKTRGLVPGLLDQELVITWNQVVEITTEKVVVEDGSVPIQGRAFAVRPAPSAGVHFAKRDVASEKA